MSPPLLGVDTGGTFTDFVLYADGTLRIHKVPSTPSDPEHAILRGIAELGLSPEDLRVVHGSTVATNTVLESKGARTVLITNRGFRDILTIGRQARADLYDLNPPLRPAPVPRELCLETGGRLGADGTVLEPLTSDDLIGVQHRVAELHPEAVAINLLFSFLDPTFEQQIEQILPQNLFVSRSSHILPEYGEYERGITTWLNASVGPVLQRYLTRLTEGLAGARVAVMQSSGGTVAAPLAAQRAVHLLLSGPAGGLEGARFIARHAGCARILTLDMGGTSTDVAMINGEPELTTEGRIAGYPVCVPMVDIHTIGAGGGSIAEIDAGGLLQVGPASAGADPGPACYGRGGMHATVTDANLVLGKLRSETFLGARMQLDIDAARQAVGGLAATLGLSITETAAGIIAVTNDRMVQALRVISVERGIDPREFTLVCFGGAAGLHVCAVAQALGIRSVLIPVHAGVLSALGMLVAPAVRHLSRALTRPLAEASQELMEAEFAALETRGRRELADEGLSTSAMTTERRVDLRYKGQSSSLTMEWLGRARTEADFHIEHRQRYGHALNVPVELVNVRVGVFARRSEAIELPRRRPRRDAGTTPELVALAESRAPAELWDRKDLRENQTVIGPALITDEVSTTLVASGWSCSCDAYGNLLLEQMGHARSAGA